MYTVLLLHIRTRSFCNVKPDTPVIKGSLTMAAKPLRHIQDIQVKFIKVGCKATSQQQGQHYKHGLGFMSLMSEPINTITHNLDKCSPDKHRLLSTFEAGTCAAQRTYKASSCRQSCLSAKQYAFTNYTWSKSFRLYRPQV